MACLTRSRKKRYKQSSKKLDNWVYDEACDTYTHPDGCQYHFETIKHSKTTSGYEQEIRIYKADDPDLAPQKGLYVNERYQALKQEETERLLSAEGSRIFSQRKVDVEPVFGQVKVCLGYKRCNLRVKRQVKIDMGLVPMANNLLKYNKKMAL